MRVGIVGGGITGLALTHALARAGVDSLLFEASPVAGGIIATSEIDGQLFERGPQRTRLVPPVVRLIEELGIEDRVVEARPGSSLFIWVRGRLRRVPRRPAGFVTADLLTLAGRARLYAEPLTGGLRGDETVAEFFSRKAGEEAYRTLFGPLVSATFAADPAQMPSRHSLPLILRPLGVHRSLLAAARRWKPGHAAACTFRGGMRELTDALVNRHADRVRLSAPVRLVEADGDGVRVVLEDGVDVFDRVVVTVPAPAAARLLAGDATTSTALATLRYNEVAVVGLRAEPPQRGFGFQTALGSPWRTRGVTWTGSLFERPGVCTAYLGGGLDPEIAGWSDEDVAGCAAREFAEIHGVPAEPVLVERAAIPRYDGAWDAVADLSPPPGVILAANYLGRLGISARIAQADGLADSLRSGAERL